VLTILVIDDELQICRVVRHALEGADAQVLVLVGGVPAIK
jgi:CheY-like chemotaxis protein